MDVVRLRTMSFKSKLGFGKYSDLSVSDLMRHSTSYLAWIYYNCSKISFISEILDYIGIDEGFRIDKPGTEPEMFRKFMNEKVARDDSNKKGLTDAYKKRLGRIHSSDYYYWGKGNLAWKNQGHKRID